MPNENDLAAEYRAAQRELRYAITTAATREAERRLDAAVRALCAESAMCAAVRLGAQRGTDTEWQDAIAAELLPEVGGSDG
jgi:hypothetical protein